MLHSQCSILNAQCSMINIKRIDIFDGPLHTDLSIFSSKCNIFIAYPLTRNLINNYAEMTITNLGPNVNASQYDWNTADTWDVTNVTVIKHFVVEIRFVSFEGWFGIFSVVSLLVRTLKRVHFIGDVIYILEE